MPKIQTPSRYLVPNAVAFGTLDGEATLVSADSPLPVVLASDTPAGSTPLAGSTNASTVTGPFTPQLGHPIWLTLSGSWTGSVVVQRSIDGGTTKLPLTMGGGVWGSFTGNAQEAVAEESQAGATYHLAITLSSGTLSYRVAQ